MVDRRAVVHGLDGVLGVVCDGSTVDPKLGVRFRGFSCDEVAEMPPEDMLLLLLTGEIPEGTTKADWAAALSLPFEVPEAAYHALTTPGCHTPMTLLSMALLALDLHSANYQGRPPKGDEWQAYCKDAELIMRIMPLFCGAVFLRTQHSLPPRDCLKWQDGLDWMGQFCSQLMIRSGSDLDLLLREYVRIHCDHGSNLSTTVAGAVSSGLATAFQSVSSGVLALAGPRHGLANMETVALFEQLMTHCEGQPNRVALKEFLRSLILAGQAIQGLGHRELEFEDPRGARLMRIARQLPSILAKPEFGFLQFLQEHITGCMHELRDELQKNVGTGYPNVDFFSGPLFLMAGLKPPACYTVVFALSRVMGWLNAAISWHVRAAGIFRPGSTTLTGLAALPALQIAK